MQLAKRASLRAAVTKSGAEQPFHASVTKLYKLPKEFLREYLTSLAPKKLDDQTLKRMEKHAEGTLRSIFYYSHGVFEKTTMPKLCLNKEVWRSAFKARHVALGSRLASIKLKEVQAADGSGSVFEVDWLEWGCFVLTPIGAFPKEGVKHFLGYEAKLDDKITDGEGNNRADIRKNWVSTLAALRFKKWNVSLLEFFTDEQKKAITKSEQAVAEDLAAMVAKAEQDRLAEEDAYSDDGSEQVGSGAAPPRVSPAKALRASQARATPPPSKKRRIVKGR